eukprot:scaffold326547_cov43-Prasinocladus_malaysianus.AAC.1
MDSLIKLHQGQSLQSSAAVVVGIDSMGYVSLLLADEISCIELLMTLCDARCHQHIKAAAT